MSGGWRECGGERLLPIFSQITTLKVTTNFLANLQPWSSPPIFSRIYNLVNSKTSTINIGQPTKKINMSPILRNRLLRDVKDHIKKSATNRCGAAHGEFMSPMKEIVSRHGPKYHAQIMTRNLGQPWPCLDLLPLLPFSLESPSTFSSCFSLIIQSFYALITS